MCKNHAKLRTYVRICIVAEKWAICYQQFDHQEYVGRKASIQFTYVTTGYTSEHIASATNPKLILDV